MSFTSDGFMALFGIILVIFYLLPAKYQIHLLIIASLIFCYFAGGIRMIFFGTISIVTTYFGALGIQGAKNQGRKNLCLGNVLLVNIGLLVLTKQCHLDKTVKIISAHNSYDKVSTSV